MLKLGGIITVSELLGAVFGLEKMDQLPALETAIRAHRSSGKQFPQLTGLPTNRGTVENIKIYFMAHLGLDGEILHEDTKDEKYYGKNEQAYELTEFGFELLESVLSEQWPRWKSARSIPKASSYKDILDYFANRVGQECPPQLVKTTDQSLIKNALKISAGVLQIDDADNLRELPKRQFEEGKKRLVEHARMETIRNPALIREAKRYFKRTHKKLFCEVCGFDFEAEYGSRGKDFIEAHHKKPISEVAGPVVLTIADLGMVCANCHRMLHRRPWISMEELSRQTKH